MSTSTVATFPTNPACPVAAVSLNSFLAPYASSFRKFRDNAILKTAAGRAFMLVFNAWYYSVAPSVADTVERNPILADISRVGLIPLFGILFGSSEAYYAAAWFSPEVGAIVAGVVAASLLGLIYVAPLAYVFDQLLCRLRRPITIFLLKPLAFWVVFSVLLAEFALILDSFTVMGLATANLALSTLTLGSIIGVEGYGQASKIPCALKHRKDSTRRIFCRSVLMLSFHRGKHYTEASFSRKDISDC
jgi:hypothetical protein